MDVLNPKSSTQPILSSGTDTPYQYPSLNTQNEEIRVLRLFAGVGGDPIHGSLSCIAIHEEDREAYETVSYVWGDPTERGSIHLEGVRFSIPASSEAALRRIRHAYLYRLVWIDSICINQMDTAERGQQVALMPQIYSKSVRNLIHFRDSPDVSDIQRNDALRNMRLVLNEARIETNNHKNYYEKVHDERGFLRVPTSPLNPEIDANSLLTLFRLPWFRRLWILQEVTLAPRNKCLWGLEKIDLIDITFAANWLCYKGKLSPGLLVDKHEGTECASLIWEFLAFADPAPWTLLTLIVRGRELLTSEKRDCIFALVGIWDRRHDSKSAASRFKRLIEPDYSKSLAAVLSDATKFMIAEDGDLGPLQLVHHVDDGWSDSGIPSWTVRADVPLQPRAEPVPLSQKFNAGGRTNIDIDLLIAECSIRTTVLHLRGFIIGTITVQSGCIENDHFESHEDGMASLIAAVRLVVTDFFSKQDAHQSDAFDRVARALVAGETLYDHAETPDPVDLLACLDAFMNWSEGKSFPNAYYYLLGSACRNRSLFCTGSGSVGIGPKLARVGDVLAILLGGHVPFVLRPCERGYCLVGEAYVDGIMYGEALNGFDVASAPIINLF